MPYFVRAWLCLLALVAAARAEPPSAAEWLPDGAVTLLQITKPAAVLEIARAAQLPAALPGMQGTEKLLSADWKGITHATYPGDAWVLLLDSGNAAALDAMAFLARAAKQWCAVADERLVVTNREQFLKGLLAPRTRAGISASPLYAQARKTAAADSAATLFVNMALVNRQPPARKALAESNSPLELLISGIVRQSLADATWAELSLRVDGAKLLLHGATDGKAASSGAAVFSVPPDGQHGILPNLEVPRQIAAASLWRDLHRFYAARDKLFPGKSSAGILLENFMEIFFTGRDLTEEVFGRVRPEVRLVVARQEYDPVIGTPREQYPAAALVFRVDRAEEFGEVMEEAWQKAIGLMNFTRGQQALPGLILDKASHAGVPFTYGYYSARSEKDRANLPARFNARPALVRTGPYLILSSTDALAKDVIDAVNREDGRVAATRAGEHTVLEFRNGADIAALLRSNAPELIRQNVISKGAKTEAAKAEVENNIRLAEHLERARLSFSSTGEGQQADLELRLR